MDQAIQIALDNSPRALMAQLSFMSSYWTYRSYKADLLPSLNASSSIGNYNRSLVSVTDSSTGEISYVANNTLSNTLSLSVNQKIVATGGTVSLSSNLTRLDQFRFDRVTYSGSPVSIIYNQPIRGYNSMKWQKELAPRRYEIAKCTYLSAMETIKSTTITHFFNVLTAQNNHKKALTNYQDTKYLYEIAVKRFDLGTITKTDLMQLELAMLNANQSINTTRVAEEIAIFNFKSYLGISAANISEMDLIPPSIVPNVVLEYEKVLDYAYKNSSHRLDQELDLVVAQQGVAQAKANRGVQIDFKANLGYTQSGSTIAESYAAMRDKEVVGLTLSVPIYDWGTSRGDVKMAQAEEQLALTEIEQAEREFEQNIRIKVLQFNNQEAQCNISLKASDISAERYEISKKRFENGTITVLSLNSALEDKDDSQINYINQLRSFWSAYYELQQISLYDFINDRDISADFDALVE
ncbi:MAG: TolC family protein [Rikenellaceae bacterium]